MFWSFQVIKRNKLFSNIVEADTWSSTNFVAP